MKIRQYGFLVAAIMTASAGAQTAPPVPSNASVQVQAGEKLYQQHCSLCHGAEGRNANVFPRPIWGPGHDIFKFNNSKGLFEYLQLVMPFDKPDKINDADKLAITAFMLERNKNIKPDGQLPAGGGAVAIK